MNKRRAYEEVTIAHGNHAVTLRPSLRAATILEERFSIPALHKAVAEFNLTTVSEVILACATSRQNAAAFLSSLRGRPLLPFVLSVSAPLTELVSMLTPAPKATELSHSPSTTKLMTWPQVFAALYDRATGWLGWTPEQAWNATPTEIDRAFSARFSTEKESDPEQAERNIAAGLDPEFDRAGLQALKGKGRDR